MKTVYFISFLLLIGMRCSSGTEDKNYLEYKKAVNTYNNRESFLETDHSILVDFIFPTIQIELDDSSLTIPYKNNHYLLINLWFKECVACIKEIPVLNEINKMQTIDVISLCRNRKEDFNTSGILDSIKYTMSFNNSNNIDSILLWPYGYPSNILLNTNGKIIKVLNQIEKNSNTYLYLKSLN